MHVTSPRSIAEIGPAAMLRKSVRIPQLLPNISRACVNGGVPLSLLPAGALDLAETIDDALEERSIVAKGSKSSCRRPCLLRPIAVLAPLPCGRGWSGTRQPHAHSSVHLGGQGCERRLPRAWQNSPDRRRRDSAWRRRAGARTRSRQAGKRGPAPAPLHRRDACLRRLVANTAPNSLVKWPTS